MRVLLYIVVAFTCCAFVCFAILLHWNIRLGFRRFTSHRTWRPEHTPLRRCHRNYVDFVTETSDKVLLRGWYVAGDHCFPTFILCHAPGSSKYASLSRLALLPQCCPAILFDFRSHGESDCDDPGGMIGQQQDLEAILRYATEQLKLRSLVIWGRCWNNIMVANLAARQDEIQGLILEGVVPTMWDAFRDQLERKFALPVQLLSPGAWILEKRWGRGARYRSFFDLSRYMANKEVLFLTAGLSRREGRYTARLMNAWSQAEVQEVHLPALHGEIIQLVRYAEPLREKLTAATTEMARRLAVKSAHGDLA